MLLLVIILSPMSWLSRIANL